MPNKSNHPELPLSTEVLNRAYDENQAKVEAAAAAAAAELQVSKSVELPLNPKILNNNHTNIHASANVALLQCLPNSNNTL